jgi:hypothetical protein
LSEPRLTEVVLALPEEARKEIAEVVLALLEAQAARGEDKNGNALPRGVTLRDTGELWDTAYATPDGVTFPAGHAQHVLPRYKADGLSPASQKKLEAEVSRIIAERTTTK